MEFSGRTDKESVSGRIESIDEFYIAIDKLLELYKTDRIEVALKRIKLIGGVSGVCAKSFPRSELSSRILSKINLCLGGDENKELVHLPNEGTIFDQPNIFIEAYYIWSDEISKYWNRQRKDKDETGRSKRRDMDGNYSQEKER